MIAITYDSRIPVLRAAGHAGAGKPGEDVICAAVTALLLTLREAVRAKGGISRLEPGNAEIRGEDASRGDFETLVRGLAYLARTYPGYVSLRRLGDREKESGSATVRADT